MNEQTYQEMFAQLQITYGQQSEGWAAHFRASVIDLDDELVLAAYHVCIRRQPPRSFPTIDKFASYVDEARKYVKAKENPKPLSQPRLGDIRNTDKGRLGLALVMRVVNEGYTTEVMADLKRTWPRHDWAAAKRDADSVRSKLHPPAGVNKARSVLDSGQA